MNIRIARNKSDLESASAIYALSWKSAYKDIFSDKLLREIPLDFWVEASNNHNTNKMERCILNAEGEDIGAGGYGISRDYNGYSELGEIASIYFLKKAWGKGYASILMQFMINELKNMGCTKIHLWVLEENKRAQRFYEKLGFTKTGKTKNFEFKGEKKITVEYKKIITPCA